MKIAIVMDLKKIEELHKKGIVSYAGLERARIITRFEEIRNNHKTLGEVYFVLSQEFCLSEYRIRNIIQESK